MERFRKCIPETREIAVEGTGASAGAIRLKESRIGKSSTETLGLLQMTKKGKGKVL